MAVEFASRLFEGELITGLLLSMPQRIKGQQKMLANVLKTNLDKSSATVKVNKEFEQDS